MNILDVLMEILVQDYRQYVLYVEPIYFMLENIVINVKKAKAFFQSRRR